MTANTSEAQTTQRKAFTDLRIVSYRDDWKQRPDPQFGIYTSFNYEDVAARRKEVMANKKSAQRRHSGVVRLECIDTTEIFGYVHPKVHARKNVAVLSRFDYSDYQPPMEHAGMSVELQVRLTLCNKPEGWVYVRCESHEDRVQLAEHLMSTGMLEDGGLGQPIHGLAFVDRELTWDNEFIVNRGKIGSPLVWDRSWSKKLKPLLQRLQERSSAERQMTHREAADYCWQRHPTCDFPNLRMIIGIIVALREKHKGLMAPVYMRWAEHAACSLAAGCSFDTVLEVAVINRFPKDMRASVTDFVYAEHDHLLMTN